MNIKEVIEYRKKFLVENKKPLFSYGDIVRIKSDDVNGLCYLVSKISLLTNTNQYVYSLLLPDDSEFFGCEEDLVKTDDNDIKEKTIEDIPVGTITDCPYIIDDGGDGVASVEIVSQDDNTSFTEVKIVSTCKVVSVASDTQIL